MERMYNVVVINEKTGVKTRMNDTPVNHSQGCAWLSKLTDYKWRRKQLDEIPQPDMPTNADLEYLGIDTDGLATYQLGFEL